MQWAKIVVTLEMAVKQSDAHHYLQEYSISLGPANDDPTMETRGVMVIKSKSKTRAKQRKGAVGNWKKVGKVTIAELKKRGLTGEQLRCLMWGRESINTPVKVKKKPQNGNIMDGLGGALTSALDVMAIAGDINITEQNNLINTNKNQEIKIPQRDEMVTSPNLATNESSSMLGALINLTNSQDTKPLPHPPPQKPPSNFDDPLRKLIQLSDTSASFDQLYNLAKIAANIPEEYIEPIQRPVSQMSIKNLTGFFAMKENCIKIIENSFKNKLQFLDHSESDSVETSVLGKLSRTRRAKSASIRAASAKSKITEKKGWNYLQHSDSSSSETGGSVNSRSMPKEEELEYAEERIARIKDSLLQEDFTTSDSSTMRPIFIDAALGNSVL